MAALAMPAASPVNPVQLALKQRWSARLRRLPARPPGAGLVSPEMLTLMVDVSIARLAGQRAARRRPARVERFMTPRAGCQCGLNLLVNYYAAGAWALREVLPPTRGNERRRVVRDLLGLARDELTALCGVCQHRGGSLCQLGAGACCRCGSRPVPPGP